MHIAVGRSGPGLTSPGQAQWRLLGVCLLGAFVLACAPAEPPEVSLVLVPPAALAGEIDAELAIEGLSALLVARLRALPEVSVQIDPAGCARDQEVTHELRIARELTATSALTSLLLRACHEPSQRVEQLVQPRDARRDWSAEAAWWVGSQLQAPPAKPELEAALDEQQMQRFLVAVARLKRRTAEDVGHAAAELEALSQAVPAFAQAHAYHAAAQMLAFEYGLVSLDQALQRADAAINAALAIAPDLGMALAARGLYYMNQERYSDAAPQLARAAALDPGDATVSLWLGNALLYDGRPREAQPWLERAQQLDPTLVSVWLSLGEAACLGGIEDACERFLADPGAGPMGQFMAALLLAHQGHFELARARLETVGSGVNRDWVVALQNDLCPMLGDSKCTPTDPAVAVSQWSRQMGTTEPLGETPKLDLWRLDMGLSAWVTAAQGDADLRLRLLAELRRVRDAGLDVPLLDLIDACLNHAAVSVAATGWLPLLRAWNCPGYAPG